MLSKPEPTHVRPPAPTARPQPIRRQSAPPAPKGPSFGQRLKNLAQNTRQKLESLPRTQQSLGTPQQHAVTSNPYESDDQYATRSQVGPELGDLKPAPKPKYTPRPTPKPRSTSIAKTSKPKPKSSTNSKSSITKAATKLAKIDPISSELKKRIITEATPAADALITAATADKPEEKDVLKKMKIAPRTLIASLEKYIPLEAEELIGEATSIDLDDADLEPLTMQVKAIANKAIAKTQKSISIDPADMVVGEDPSVELAAVMAASAPPATGTPSVSIQPVGMSFFERFALSTMIAAENHLATLPKPDASSPTESEAPDEIAEPVIIEDPEAVKFVSNDIPPTHVSPGLDEMVISSTSQTDFDLNDSEMAFIGNVQVKSPQFNLRADKFVVHLKKDNSGMAFGEAIGNVVIEMRENGRPTGYSGLAGNAVYHPTDGKITLSNWPKIRQQFKEHVAVTRDTKMVLYTDGRVKTIGRNRTVIRK